MSWRELTRSAGAVWRWWWVVITGVFLTIIGAILDISSDIRVPYWFWGYPALLGLAVACFAALHSDRLRHSPHVNLRLEPTADGQVGYVIEIRQVGGQIQPSMKMHCRFINHGARIEIVGLEGRWSGGWRSPLGEHFERRMPLRNAEELVSRKKLGEPLHIPLEPASQTEVLTLEFDNLFRRDIRLPVHSSFLIRMKIVGARDCDAHVADFRLARGSIGSGASPVNVTLIPGTTDFPVRVV